MTSTFQYVNKGQLPSWVRHGTFPCCTSAAADIDFNLSDRSRHVPQLKVFLSIHISLNHLEHARTENRLRGEQIIEINEDSLKGLSSHYPLIKPPFKRFMHKKTIQGNHCLYKTLVYLNCLDCGLRLTSEDFQYIFWSLSLSGMGPV